MVASLFRKLRKLLEVFLKISPPEDKERLRWEYFEWATYYYISARFAHFGRLIPTAGNLFHHAIEMYLKGHLALKLNERERWKLRHSLKRIWRQFKRNVGDTALIKFDSIIKELDKYEDIRYPEKFVRKGATILFGLTRVTPSGHTTGAAHPQFQHYVHEIDDLVATVFQKTGLDPAFFLQILSEDGKAYLNKDNPMKQVWGL